MHAVPMVFCGAFRSALIFAMQEIVEDPVRCTRAWKLFFLPRMLLFEPVRRGLMPRTKLESRFRQFQSGDWTSLLLETAADSEEIPVLSRGRRDTKDNEAKRVAGNGSGATWGIVCSEAGFGGSCSGSRYVGNVGRARSVALESPGNRSMKRWLRKARRGATAGPSGMTSDHLFPSSKVRQIRISWFRLERCCPWGKCQSQF